MSVERPTNLRIENARSKEEELNESVALVLLVLADYQNGGAEPNPLVWTVIEKKSKEKTGKKAGQISLPVETIKVEESTNGNFFGSLSEFTDDDSVVESQLFYVPNRSISKGVLSFRGNPMDLAVIFYDGPLNKDLRPIDDSELSPNGWRALLSLQNETQEVLREEVVGAVLDFEDRTRGISNLFSDYRAQPDLKRPITDILPIGYVSLRDFIEERELLEDVDIQVKGQRLSLE